MDLHQNVILEGLLKAARIHQNELGGSRVLRGVKWVLLAVIIAFFLDAFFHLSPALRLGLLVFICLLALGLLACGWYLAFIRQRRFEHIARLLEERHPALGSKLINMLQLHALSQDAAFSELTRELARRAVADYTDQLKQFDLPALARTNTLSRELKKAALALVVFATLLFAFFPITQAELPRFVDPFGDHPPYSLTQLAIVEPGANGTNVIYGRGIVIKARAIGHQPKEVFVTAYPPEHPEKAITLPMFDKGPAGYQQMLDKITTPLLVYVHTKSRQTRSKQVPVNLILTPQLEAAFVQTTPPSYTGLKPEEKPCQFKGLKALQGSLMRFRLQSNRPLSNGTLEVISGDGPPLRVDMLKTGEREVSGQFEVRESGRIRLALMDVDGIPSRDTWESPLTVTYDLPPEVSLLDPENDAVVAIDYKPQPVVEAHDDYGLKTVRIHLGINGVFSAPKIVEYSDRRLSTRETVELDFRMLGAKPGDVISMFAEALDHYPEGHVTRSKTVHLLLISVEEYNQLLREHSDMTILENKYGELIAQLNDLIKEQKELATEIKQAQESLARSAAPQDARARSLDALLARQNELNQKLLRQSEQMQNFVRDNPLYDVEREIEKELRQSAQNIRNSLELNKADTDQIARRSAPDNGARIATPELFEDLSKAAEEHAKRLEAAADQTGKNVLETIQDLEALHELIKDFNQFEDLYKAQEELALHARAYNRPGLLERDEQLALKSMATIEKNVADTLAQLSEKLKKDASVAETNFPKAAKSARDLSSKIEEARLEYLARYATDQMLSAQGDKSSQAADRLRDEMAKLFSQCMTMPGGKPDQGELDRYLRLQRAMEPGRTFAQMMSSRNFRKLGGNKGGTGAEGSGEGQNGQSGYAVMDKNALSVMGHESLVTRNSASSKFSDKISASSSAGKNEAEAASAYAPVSHLKGLNPVNRQSGAVQTETLQTDYQRVVEEYFKAITK